MIHLSPKLLLKHTTRYLHFMNVLIPNWFISLYLQYLQSHLFHCFLPFQNVHFSVQPYLLFWNLTYNEWALHHFCLTLTQLKALLGGLVKTAGALFHIERLCQFEGFFHRFWFGILINFGLCIWMYFGFGIRISFGKDHISFFKPYCRYLFDIGCLMVFIKTFTEWNSSMKILFIFMLVLFFFQLFFSAAIHRSAIPYDIHIKLR